jgi:tRNA-Thr(GGU) m(6)t(6)A37 methyltransferase TsaA
LPYYRDYSSSKNDDFMTISLKPIGTVVNDRLSATDDFWGTVISEIHLAPEIPGEAFDHIEDFSHLEIIYFFDRVDDLDIVYSGRPRGNPDYPRVGIFGQRKKDRPNRIGLCTVELLEHTHRTLKVKWLDAINGSPIIDIKPVFKEFTPQNTTRQPFWVADLMSNYWR